MFELVHDGGTIFQHILELVSREVMSCQGDLHSTCSRNLCGRLRAGRFCGHVAVAWPVVFMCQKNWPILGNQIVLVVCLVLEIPMIWSGFN